LVQPQNPQPATRTLRAKCHSIRWAMTTPTQITTSNSIHY
jgi:hypothetical protein